MKAKKVSVASLEESTAVLFHEFISAVNSTNYSSYLVQGDNMYLNAFNNDLIPRKGFLSLNLQTVVCCRWLD